jgi:tRNA1(Val) A37 N6-methylase TrmN6
LFQNEKPEQKMRPNRKGVVFRGALHMEVFMEQLVNGMTLEIPQNAFPLSTDSMVLADFIRLPAGSTVLDLGSGCGTLGVLLCAKDPGCSVTGIELEEGAHLAALDNIRRNQLQDRLHSVCADLRSVNRLFPSGSFRYCISNPPYFSGGPAARLTFARRDDCCNPEDLFRSAAWALQYGGSFFLVHKPERLGQLCGCATAAGLEPKRLRLVRHQEDKPITLILLECRKGGKPGLQIDELSLYCKDGSPTADYRRIYHIQED